MSAEMDVTFNLFRARNPEWYKEWLITQKSLVQKEIDNKEKVIGRPLDRDEKLEVALLWQKDHSVTEKKKFLSQYPEK